MNKILPIIVFFTGACILIIELVAIRILAPYFGNTMFTVSSVLSVILVALSLGYYFGGKMADKYPNLNYFFTILTMSGILVLLFYFLSLFILPVISQTIPITYGPLISSILLFLFPAILLGFLSPYAIKLQNSLSPTVGIGSVSGVIFFWSTLGSIVGSLATGFFLIPNFGADKIFIYSGLFLFFLGSIPLIYLRFKRIYLIIFLIISLIFFGFLNRKDYQLEVGTVFQKDGKYEKITIKDDIYEGRPTRFFMQDKSLSGAMFLDTDDYRDMTYGYTKYYSLYKILDTKPTNLLVLGGGIYTVPKALQSELPEAIIDVVDIEPMLLDLAQQYFNVIPTDKLNTYTVDGRRFLQESDQRYDFIFSDVYSSLFSIPYQFTTIEFFNLAKDHLEEDGIFVANLIGNLSRIDESLIFTIFNTFRQVFPNSYLFAVEEPNGIDLQNIMMVGINGEAEIDWKNLKNFEDSTLNNLYKKRVNLNRFNLDQYSILTDNYSPVDYLTGQTIKQIYKNNNLPQGAEMMSLIKQQLSFGPRYSGSEGNKRTQDLIISELETYVSEIKQQSWTERVMQEVEYKNIIGKIRPDLDQRIILATHYDSKRFANLDIKTRQHLPVTGANDSASGVAVLLELARVLNLQENELNVGVDLVFFDGEEGDLDVDHDYSNWYPIGSTYFAERIDDIYSVNKPQSGIVIDMVCNKDLVIYKEQNSINLAPDLVDNFWSLATSLYPKNFNNFSTYKITDDHVPLNNVGIPSILLIDHDYKDFHTIKDDINNCREDSLEVTAKTLLKYVTNI